MSKKIKPECGENEKYCVKCDKIKIKEYFNSHKGKKDGLNSYCKECNKKVSKGYYDDNKKHHIAVIKERSKKNILENQKKILDYLLENPCVDCDNPNPIVLEFDHIDASKKFKGVSKMLYEGYSWIKIKNEIDKCDVRCANCHRIRTAEQFNWYKNI